MAYSVLVVDDEAVIRARLKGYFEKEGYRVVEAADGEQMWYEFNRQHIDLIMLDINLPGVDGLSLTRELRSRSHVGIILVSGRDESIDKIVGLEMGADDYVTKPFELRELLVRVKNLLWRISLVKQAELAVAEELSQPDDVLSFEGYQLELNSRKLRHGDVLIKLTKAEFELLVAFALHPQQVLSRERLMQQTSHRNLDVNDRTIDVIIRRLRNKLDTELFVTVHGEGYLFAAKVDD
ncbi:two-component system response regulator TorR [Shewanella sp. SP2S2-4]|uniref:two-component system response regulator TorR n=1 Tax=Shewanella TaxID=22 RepID=UPI000CA241F7|nr:MULTISPECIES: two-component system response regulator TorR [unclassified Shewanella]MBU1391692.1 two-component system response regulator TorR [Gammaproteobacteria bacterium]QYX63770.1 two-component system response regulator TorR [Shewanella putrefaciens]AUD61337.1 DNA-binding response regulator [Shewanella sp. Pdp11]MBU1479786.1 two-component system response regulator TorR [Gammaproteobacteria bacterium]MBU2002771.1 two-component system response regulator TorR [Gammaproteobacteria bacterium